MHPHQALLHLATVVVVTVEEATGQEGSLADLPPGDPEDRRLGPTLSE